MKTEKEFSTIFFDSCQHSNEHEKFVADLSGHYWLDLTTHLNRYFSIEDRLLITEKAARLLSENLKTTEPDAAWKNVIRSFIEENNWGFQSISKKPIVQKSEEQVIFWKFFKYAWAFFQSMIILKIAVYYFGLEAAENPDQVSRLWVWLFFGISAGSLAFFAYRNRHDQG